MSLYREAGRARRRRRIAIGVAVAAIALVVLIVVLATSGGPPSHADRVKSAKSAASEALDGLEVLTVEYGQAVPGGRWQRSTSSQRRSPGALTSHPPSAPPERHCSRSRRKLGRMDVWDLTAL